MLAADARYLAHCSLNPQAAKAQAKREHALKKAHAYILLVDAIKKRNISGAIHAIRLQPACVWLLWEPVWIRLKRLIVRA